MFAFLLTRNPRVKLNFWALSSTLLTNFAPGLVCCSGSMMHTKDCTKLPTHTKARCEFYPGSHVKRFPVPDHLVPWSEPFPGYDPVDYTAESILKGPSYADRDIRHGVLQNGPLLYYNATSQNVDRCSYMGIYDVKDGVPLNPCGRTGLKGRGLLGRWGPNHAADPVVTRWKRNRRGEIVRIKNKPVLEFVAIRRRDTGEWAIPGGMVESGDSVSNTLKKEFGEEAMNSIEASREEKEEIKRHIAECFRIGFSVFQGYVDDPRNTDNAWMETVAKNFHDDTGETFDRFKLQAGDDANAVSWTEISHELKLYASHLNMIRNVALMHGAYFGENDLGD